MVVIMVTIVIVARVSTHLFSSRWAELLPRPVFPAQGNVSVLAADDNLLAALDDPALAIEPHQQGGRFPGIHRRVGKIELGHGIVGLW